MVLRRRTLRDGRRSATFCWTSPESPNLRRSSPQTPGSAFCGFSPRARRHPLAAVHPQASLSTSVVCSASPSWSRELPSHTVAEPAAPVQRRERVDTSIVMAGRSVADAGQRERSRIVRIVSFGERRADPRNDGGSRSTWPASPLNPDAPAGDVLARRRWYARRDSSAPCFASAFSSVSRSSSRRLAYVLLSAVSVQLTFSDSNCSECRVCNAGTDGGKSSPPPPQLPALHVVKPDSDRCPFAGFDTKNDKVTTTSSWWRTRLCKRRLCRKETRESLPAFPGLAGQAGPSYLL